MKTIRLSFALLLLTCLSVINLKASIVAPTSVIQTNYGGSPVVIGANNAKCTTMVQQPIFAHWDRSVKNRIGLEINYDYSGYVATAQEVLVKLAVSRKDASNNALSDTTVYLKVNYQTHLDSNQLAKNYCQFNAAYWVEAKIDSIYVNGSSVTTLPANLRITNDILVDRYFNYSNYSSTDYGLETLPITTDCGNTPTSIQLTWDANPQITEYQLEWMHINDYGFDPMQPNALNPNPISPASLAFNFRKNSTRISTTSNHFTLNLIYNRGWIVYRIRGIGYINQNENEEIFGAWSLPDEGFVGNVNPDERFQITDAIAHENSLNWQYAATYAEEGKLKEVVSYFDGSLRNRQSVTKINSDNNTIVGETIYDHQGRPAIQVLPVPVPAGECTNYSSQALRFYPNFNLFDDASAPGAYTRLNFDIDKNGCDVSADPMSPTSGASNYYSPSNPDQTAAQGYVPDAKKYPFTQVEYTPDNTGRIRRQSGVGPEFQLGNDHETKYLYGQPDQLVLDRLFGSEVGYANHYKENAVIDANGQVSISYLDQEGRVIATALAAESPESFKKLSSAEQQAIPLTINAFGNENNQNVSADESIHFYKELIVTNPSEYKFSYDFEIAPLQDECLPNLCINCIYDLEMKLIDECGVNLFPEELEQKITGQFTHDAETNTYVFHANCESPSNFEFEQLIGVNLQVGSYSLSKTLTVNAAARQAYIDTYLNAANEECLKDLEDFIEEELAQIDLSGCEVTCEQCRENLGSLEDFMTKGEGSANDYYQAVKACDQLCNTETISLCDVTRNLMEMDMAPGGQYGEYLNTLTNEIDFATFPISIYNPNHLLPTDEAEPWRVPYFTDGQYTYEVYREDNGDTSKIWLHQLADGTWIPEPLTAADILWDPIEQANYVLPNRLLHLNDFILNYSHSWGKSLLIYHPEFCYLESCYGFEKAPEGFALSSEDFDAKLMQINTFAEAIDKGFLSDDLAFIFDTNLPSNPNPNVLEDWFQPTNDDFSSTDHAWDPFVHLGEQYGDCYSTSTDLADRWNNYKTINGVTYSMPEIAAYLSRCSNNPNASPIEGCYNFGGTFNGTYSVAILDKEWQLLRSLYLAEKDLLRATITKCYALSCSPNGYCGCIGNADYSLAGLVSQQFSSDPRNPCGTTMYGTYQGKTRRFISAEDITSISASQSTNTAVYEYYLATGQCPVPTATQAILNKLLNTGQLTSSSVLLNDFPEFSSLLVAMNNMQLPALIPTVYQEAEEPDDNTLQLTWTNNLDGSLFARITLTKAGALSWDDMNKFSGIQPVSGSVSQFEMVGKNVNPSDYVVIDQTAITGTLEVLTFEDCRNFGQDCEPNLLGNDVSEILNHVALKHSFHSGGFDVSLKSLTETENNPFGKKQKRGGMEASPAENEGDSLLNEASTRSNLQTSRIEKLLGTTNELFIRTIDDRMYIIYDSLEENGKRLQIAFTDVTVINNSEKTRILSKLIPVSGNTFKILGYDAKLNPTVIINGMIAFLDSLNGQQSVPIADCDLPIPNACKTPEHEAFRSLENVLKDVIANGNTFLESPFMNQALLNQLPFGLSQTDNKYDPETNIATIAYKECQMTFKFPTPKTYLQLREIVRVEVHGNPDVFGNYHEIKLYAKFEVASGSFEYDYIYGTTCFKLKPCDVCVEGDDDLQTITDKRASRIAKGLFYENAYFFEDLADSAFVIPVEVHEKYGKYSAFVDSLNAIFASENLDLIKKMPLADFAGDAYYLQVDNYIRFGQRHNYKRNLEELSNFKKFVIYYGVGTNVEREYGEYFNQVNTYNANRDTLTQSEIIPIDLTSFIAANLAEKGDAYGNYLQSLPHTMNPIDILTHFSVDTVDTSAEEELYRKYASSYLNFFERQDSLPNELRCFESRKLYPLLSFEDMLEMNGFCPDSASADFESYLAQLNDTTSCPSEFPEFDACYSTTDFTQRKSTQRLYLQWIEAVEGYNESYHATYNEHALELPERAYKLFINSFPNSGIVQDYLKYLKPFHNDEEFNNGDAPASLIHYYQLKMDSITIENTDCASIYSDYVQAISDFNVWVDNNDFPYRVNAVNYEDFIASGSCYCIDRFYQNLNYITANSQNFSNEENFYLYVELSHICSNDCRTQYKQYEVAINVFNDWADHAEFPNTIDSLVSYEDFVKSGACLCIEQLYEKLRFVTEHKIEFLDSANFTAYLDLTKLCEPSCQEAFIKYQQITQKFNDWAANKEFPNTLAIITDYQEFVDAGLCLCIEAYAEKLQYVVKNSENFKAPETFNEYTNLFNICDVPCIGAYKKYIEVTKKFNRWAKSFGYPFLLEENLSYEEFIQSGACQCIDLYYDKMMSVVKNPDKFKDKGIFYAYADLSNLCEKTCKEAFNKYEAATKKFNSWAVKNNYPYYIQEIATYEGFMESGACLCIETYFNKLLDIAQNEKEFDSEDEFYHFIDLSQLCKKPCQPDVLDPNDITPAVSTEVKQVDPCVEMATNNAYFNAQQRYEDYLNQLKTDLYERYTKHCLGLKENFTYTYNDKTYHFTLYYYDQAGNLIKTIPPAGVSPLNVTEDGVGLSLQIANDRRNNVKSVFTNHRLATTYEYNSLNQLVSQKTPDTDAMNEFALTLPNGLPYQLVTNRIQMLDEKTGYLAGELGTRGYLFRTNNGGANWTKVKGIVASDFNKVEMLDAQVGFAVGAKGTVMKTIDGGNSWDWVSLMDVAWDGPLPDLYDIDIRSGNSPIVTIVGDENFIAQSLDLTTFDIWNQGFEDFYFNVKSIDHDATGYKIAVVNEDFSVIFERDFTASTWTVNPNFKGLELSLITEYGGYDETDGQALRMAFGEDGRTYIVSKTEPLSLLYSSNLVSKIEAVKFFNENQGIAIQDQQLLRTTDKARNWNVIDNANYYNALSISNNKNSILAVGDNKLITLIVPSDNYNADRVSIPFNLANVDFEKSWHYSENNQTIAVLSAGGNFYYSWNIASAAPQWHTFSGGFASSVKSLELRKEGNTIKGFALTNAGDLFALNISGSTGSATPFSGAALTTVKLIKKEVTNPKIAILYTNGTLNSYDPATATETPIYSGLTAANYSDMVVEGMDFTLASATGFDKITQNGSSAYELTAYTFFAEKLNDILYDATNDNWMAVGDDGTIFKHDASNGNWNLQQLQSNYHINQILHDGNDLYVAGSHGLLGKLVENSGVYSYDFLKLVNMTPVPFAVANDLYDFAINGTKMYAVGTDGIVLSSSDYATVRFAKATASDFDLNAICALPGNEHFISAGDKSMLIDHNGASSLKREELFPPALKDVHFSGGIFGTVSGASAFMRTTANAGQAWNIVLPETTPANFVLSVATLPDGTAIGAANADLKMIESGVATSISGTTSLAHLNEAAANGNFAYFVDQNGATATVYSFDATTQTYSLLNSFNGVVNALKILNNGSYVVAGENGLFAYVNTAGNVYLENPTELGNKDFNDIAVLDALTFVLVGNDGAYYHSKNATDDGNGYLQSCSWFQQTGVFDGNTDPYLVNASSNVDLHTVAFGSSTLGVMGGKYKSSFAAFGNEQHCYVRRVYDAPERYSARFYYDKLGRLVVSQNARQYNADQVGENAYKKYSYSLYDALGRVIEAGEKTDNSDVTFRTIFGTYVSDIYNPSVIDDAKLQAWIEGAGERREVTRSYYDRTVLTALPSGFIPNPNTQRKRITHVTYEELYDGDDQTYDHATHYDYDIHGNVKTLLQDNRKMKEQFSSLASQQFKRLDYRYDLVSGNVHRMSVQNGEVDQWHHAYRYDADNRIVEAYTNKNTPLTDIQRPSYDLVNELVVNEDWENDAKYFYYAHGPLARTEIGDKQLQGFDYVYNLQGWIKGVNAIETDKDPGKDGFGGVNNSFAKDISAFSLEYFNNDYQAINNETPFATVNSSSHAASNSSALYNGNIRYMQTHLTNPTTGEAMPMLNAYQYDQLNRLLESRSYENSLSANEWNPIAYNNEYFNRFSYDAMGNILHQDRHLRDGTKIENMTYQYQYEDPTNQQRLMRNRLYHINDDIASTLNTSDIDDMGTFDSDIEDINVNNNYAYDEEGRLVKDVQEGIQKIEWTVTGKVKKVVRVSESEKKYLTFDYDAMGHRIAKHVYNNETNMLEKSTYYILDVQGNQMSMYEHVPLETTVEYNLVERNIYGSSRTGTFTEKINVLTATYQYSNISQSTGLKFYEFTNHLGNALSVFSDTKIPLDGDSNGEVDEFKVQIVSVSDYSPFGVQLDGRTVSAESYRYGFNGKEKDNEVKGQGNSYDFGLRFFDPRLATMLSTDPRTPEYPWQSPYVYHRNSPIHWIDFIGGGDPPEKIKGVYFVEIKNFTVEIINSNCMGDFTGTCKGQYISSYSDNYFVNLQQYKATSLWSYVDVVLPGAGCDDGWETIGQNVENGKISGEKTDNKRAFMAQDKKGNWKVGLGNPPKDSKVGFGGGIPIVINGQKYGEKTVGEYLSALGYENQNDKSVGKVILGYNSKANAMMLVVSPDELENGGMTLDEIRDKLVSLGYDNVMAFDGGSSATLIQERIELVSPSTVKDNTIPTGLKISGN